MNVSALISNVLRDYFGGVLPGTFRVLPDGQFHEETRQILVDGIMRRASRSGYALRDGWRLDVRRDGYAVGVFTIAPDGTEHTATSSAGWLVMS